MRVPVRTTTMQICSQSKKLQPGKLAIWKSANQLDSEQDLCVDGGARLAFVLLIDI